MLLLGYANSCLAVIHSKGIDDQARLPYWEIRDQGMSLRLVQRLPDQSRGFFEARNFSSDTAERIAQSCIFQTVFKNISSGATASPLAYDLSKWEVHTAKGQQGLKLREHWRKEWPDGRVSETSRIALEWSLLPTRQSFQPDDYNWGMTSFNLRPGTVYDLTVVWLQYDKTHRAVIKNIQCAPDIHPETKS